MKVANKRKSNFKKVIILFFILIIFCFLFFYSRSNIKSFSLSSFLSSFTHSYSVIKQDTNKQYAGIGQEKVENEDGYFTTFTTSAPHKKVYKEYKQNGTASWSNHTYWGGTMEENGCGITTLAIILSGYGKNVTPEDLRKKYYPVLDSQDISEELAKTYHIKNSDFLYDNTHLSNQFIIEYLQTNRPILICLWNNPSDNRWTTASHYMVLLASDGDHMVYVSNPNGLENDSKSSGWYDINEITPYLAKVLLIESDS